MKPNFSFFNSHFSNRAGFTLIELLIVISIIGVLMTLATINFIGVRERARDAQRKSDILQIQVALEMYRADNDGKYVPHAAWPTCPNPLTDATGAIKYMQKYPCDPKGSTYYYNGRYLYLLTNANSTAYVLAACLENSKDTDPRNVTAPPGGFPNTCESGKYFTVTNP